MPLINAEPIQSQIYRVSYMVCQGVVENVIVTPDGLYTLYFVKNGKMVTATGKVINIVQNRRAPGSSYILFDHSTDNSSRRERILFCQIQVIRDVTPNDAYNIALKHGFVGSETDWLESLRGANGKSAYDLAVEAGFEGTEEEYLVSLKGKDGKSAYEIATDLGFTGTEQEWLDTLQGKDGKSAYEVAVSMGFTGTEQEWLKSLQGEQGTNGKSAYEIAVDHGFEGTEEEWLSSFGDVSGMQSQITEIKGKLKWVYGMVVS